MLGYSNSKDRRNTDSRLGFQQEEALHAYLASTASAKLLVTTY